MQRSWISQMRKGLVELAVLAALAPGEAYGYEIIKRLERIEGLSFTASTVYPLLARSTAAGHLRVRTAPSGKGPPRRYYRLTDAGRQRLREMLFEFRHLAQAIESLVEGERHG